MMSNSYQELPDAPWIREAEIFGPPGDEEITYSCPVCGADEPEDFYFDRGGDICGCSECMKRKDAYEYMYDKLMDERRDYAGYR